jgi:hypothetical protein
MKWRVWTGGGVVVSVALAGLVFLALRVPANSLLRRAIPLEKTKGLFGDGRQYFWLSEGKVLKVVAGHEEGSLASILLDTTTGRSETLQGLGSVLRSCAKGDHLFLPRLSPDGQWLLLVSVCGSRTNAEHVAVRLDGSASYSWAKPFEGLGVGWLPDSRRWVQFFTRDAQTFVSVYSLDSPDVSEYAVKGLLVAGFLGVTRDNSALVECAKKEEGLALHGRESVTLARINLAAFTTQGMPFRVSVRDREAIVAYRLSPDGTKIAWLCHRRSVLPRLRLRNQFPFFHLAKEFEEFLSVSTADGGAAREIGRWRLGQNRPVGSVSDLCWLPDSRRVSFVYSNTLWTVSVD